MEGMGQMGRLRGVTPDPLFLQYGGTFHCFTGRTFIHSFHKLN